MQYSKDLINFLKSRNFTFLTQLNLNEEDLNAVSNILDRYRRNENSFDMKFMYITNSFSKDLNAININVVKNNLCYKELSDLDKYGIKLNYINFPYQTISTDEFIEHKFYSDMLTASIMPGENTIDIQDLQKAVKYFNNIKPISKEENNIQIDDDIMSLIIQKLYSYINEARQKIFIDSAYYIIYKKEDKVTIDLYINNYLMGYIRNPGSIEINGIKINIMYIKHHYTEYGTSISKANILYDVSGNITSFVDHINGNKKENINKNKLVKKYGGYV